MSHAIDCFSRRTLRTVSAALGFVGLYAACTSDVEPSDGPPQTDAGPRFTDIGKPCASASDCSGNACVELLPLGGGIEKRCSAPCERDFDCVPGWLCSSAGVGEPLLCSCSGRKETCDGLDNDCNGVADDETLADESCAERGEGICVNGKCGCENRCGGACVDVKTNSLHCGACNAACPPGATCSEGACVCNAPGPVDVDADAGGDGATDAAVDASPAHTPSMMLCDYTCVDVSSDPRRCGGCGNVCAPNEACVDSRCTCKGKQCGGKCVDTATDLDHCGECGERCDYACGEGRCGAETIAAGQAGFKSYSLLGSKIYWHRNERLLACEKHNCTSPAVVDTYRWLMGFSVTQSKIYVRLDEFPPDQEVTLANRFAGVGYCPLGGCDGPPNAYTKATHLTPGGYTIDRLVSSMVATPERLFYAACPGDVCTPPMRVRTCDLTNDCAGGPQTLAEEPGVDSVAIIGVDSGRVFWRTQSASGYRVRSCAVPDCAGGPTTIVSGAAAVADATIAGGSIFLALENASNRADTGIVRCAATGCAAPTVVASAAGSQPDTQGPGFKASSVAAIADRVYWSGGQPGISSCVLAAGGGCAGPITVFEADRGVAGPLAVDETSVYWIDGAQSLKRFSHDLQVRGRR